jgi:hypothetical protein
MKRLYPSSSAFMLGELVVTEYESGCLRAILLASEGARTPIPSIYEKVGAAHEEWYETQLKQDPRLITYTREVPIKFPVPGVEGVLYSGRIDVLSAYDKAGIVLHETKGTISKNTRLSVIRKGKVKLNHLAQLVSYMIAKETTKGKIVAGYYEQAEDGTLIHQEGREFKVEIDNDGSILVDGVPTGYSVFDQINHRTAAAKVLVGDSVPARPDKHDQKWGGPCGNCFNRENCDKFDRGEIDGREAFIAAGREAARAYVPGPEPEPFRIKPAKASKPLKAKRARTGSNKKKSTEAN